MTNLKYFPIVVSGPSGSGKTKLIEYIEANNPEFIEAFGCTTRSRRPNEVAAMYFISREEFEAMIKLGAFIEYCDYNNQLYGIPKNELVKLDSRYLIFNVSFSSASVVKEMDLRTKMIYLLPPTKEELYDRLKERGTERERRYSLGMEETIAHALKYEYLLLSEQDNMDSIYADFMDIVTQKDASNAHKLTLAKNRDFVRCYYK